LHENGGYTLITPSSSWWMGMASCGNARQTPTINLTATADEPYANDGSHQRQLSPLPFERPV
jgi:hypothetical protein